MGNLLTKRLSENPIVAAIKSADKLDEALKSNVEIIFLLTGDVFNLKEMVDRIHKRRKAVFVHVDLIEGIAADPVVFALSAKAFNRMVLLRQKVI